MLPPSLGPETDRHLSHLASAPHLLEDRRYSISANHASVSQHYWDGIDERRYVAWRRVRRVR